MEPKCSMGGTLDRHNISSKFRCVWRCFNSLDKEKMIDHTEDKCNWYLKSPEEIREGKI